MCLRSWSESLTCAFQLVLRQSQFNVSPLWETFVWTTSPTERIRAWQTDERFMWQRLHLVSMDVGSQDVPLKWWSCGAMWFDRLENDILMQCLNYHCNLCISTHDESPYGFMLVVVWVNTWHHGMVVFAPDMGFPPKYLFDTARDEKLDAKASWKHYAWDTLGSPAVDETKGLRSTTWRDAVTTAIFQFGTILPLCWILLAWLSFNARLMSIHRASCWKRDICNGKWKNVPSF